MGRLDPLVLALMTTAVVVAWFCWSWRPEKVECSRRCEVLSEITKNVSFKEDPCFLSLVVVTVRWLLPTRATAPPKCAYHFVCLYVLMFIFWPFKTRSGSRPEQVDPRERGVQAVHGGQG